MVTNSKRRHPYIDYIKLREMSLLELVTITNTLNCFGAFYYCDPYFIITIIQYTLYIIWALQHFQSVSKLTTCKFLLDLQCKLHESDAFVTLHCYNLLYDSYRNNYYCISVPLGYTFYSIVILQQCQYNYWTAILKPTKLVCIIYNYI